jgi:hypothetical protein
MIAQSASSAQKVEINAPFDLRIKTTTEQGHSAMHGSNKRHQLIAIDSSSLNMELDDNPQ